MRRSKLETCMDLLKVIARGETKPTRVMYKSNLAWNPMQRYLQLLMSQGLIISEQKGDRTLYSITEKGRRVLAYFGEVTRVVKVD